MTFTEQYSLALPDLPKRRRIIATAALVVLALLVGVAYYVTLHTQNEVAATLDARINAGIRASEQVAREKFLVTNDELRFFSNIEELAALKRATDADGRDPETGESADDLRTRYEGLLYSFILSKPRILQMRVILNNKRADEWIRVERVSDRVFVSPEEERQSKADRYYVKALRNKAPGEIFWTPIDLNIESGQIERPHRPVIRGARVLGDSTDQAWGFLIINYDANVVLSEITSAFPGRGQIYTYRADGYYIQHPDPAQAFAFQLAPDMALRHSDEFIYEPTTWVDAPSLLLAKNVITGEESVAVISSRERFSQYALSERGGFAIHLPRAEFDKQVSRIALPTILLFALGDILLGIILTWFYLRLMRQRAISQVFGLSSQWNAAQSDAALSLLMSRAPISIAMLDRNYRYLAVSQHWCKDFNIPAERLIGKDHRQLFPQLRRPIQQLVDRAIDGSEQHGQYRYIDKDGQTVEVNLRVAPWLAPDKSVAGVVIIAY